ncbi:chorismate synthase, partial [Chloroflexota bacterium]
SNEITQVTGPRPGHADLAGALKYNQKDIRNILERASARETVARVMAGAVARKLLGEFEIKVTSHTVQIGAVRLPYLPYDFQKVASVFELDPDIRCINPETSKKMKATIIEARAKGDTLGGIVEVMATGVPVGLGSVMHYDRRLDSHIAQALMSIPSVKGITIGEAIKIAGMLGSETRDEISFQENHFSRKTNKMGGIEGGMSNGEDIICQVYHKPISTLGSNSFTVDIKTHKPALATTERSDVCIVPRAGVISESMLAFVLARAMIEKFGSDHINEMKRNFYNYLNSLYEL